MVEAPEPDNSQTGGPHAMQMLIEGDVNNQALRVVREEEQRDSIVTQDYKGEE